MKNKGIKISAIFLVLLVLGIVILLVVSSDSVAHNSNIGRTGCPTESNFTDVWNSWSYNYINKNPHNSVEEQMQDWNALMRVNECGEEWFDPLADLIEQQTASATPVYWEYDSN